MTSHPLYLSSYQCYFFPHMDCIDDIPPTLFMRSHPLYMSTSYPSYCIQQRINCVCTITATVPVSPTHPFNDIKHFLYTTLHPLYVKHQIHCIRYHIHSLRHHATLLMTSHALYSCHHSHDI